MIKTAETAPVETQAIVNGITNRIGSGVPSCSLSNADILSFAVSARGRLCRMADECRFLAVERKESATGYFTHLAEDCEVEAQKLGMVADEMQRRERGKS